MSSAVVVFIGALLVPAAALTGWMLIRPYRLLLDDEGFTLTGGFVRKPTKVPWTDIEGFHMMGPFHNRFIGYDFRPGVENKPGWIWAGRFFGAEAALPKSWPGSSDKMLDDLNAAWETATRRSA